MRKENLRTRVLDVYIIFLSIISLLAGIAMILYCYFGLHITLYNPYMLYGVLVYLGILGIRYYRKEVEL